MISTKFLAAFFTLFFIGAGLAAPEPSRPMSLGDVLFPPEMIMQHAQELGIDDAQKEEIHAEFEKVSARFPELQQNLQKEMSAMNELAAHEPLDQQKTLAQLDKVLDAEREIKRTQVTLMLSIRAKLKPEQITKLNALREKHGAEARNGNSGEGQPPQSLQTKVHEIQARAQHANQDGKDLSSLRGIMEELQPLMQARKFKEAEATADRALKNLDEIEKK